MPTELDFRSEPPPLFDTDVLRCFESLGDNCEFGLVQSSVGVNQLGFFLFNNTGFGPLLRALDTEFCDFEDPKDIRLEVAVNRELIVHLPEYDLRYHTFYQAGSVDESDLIARQKRFLSFLARKCVDDLKSGRKIFVRKDCPDRTPQDMTRLLGALQRYGPNRLLWVSEACDRDLTIPPEPVQPGLVHGYMDVFCRYEDASTFSFRWFELCREALRLFGGGTVAPLPVGPVETVLSPQGKVLSNAILDGRTGEIVSGETLPNLKIVVRLPAAVDLMGDGDTPPSRLFSTPAFAQFRKQMKGRTEPVLIFRDRYDFEFITSLNDLVNPRIPRLRLPQNAAAFVKQLFLPTPIY